MCPRSQLRSLVLHGRDGDKKAFEEGEGEWMGAVNTSCESPHYRKFRLFSRKTTQESMDAGGKEDPADSLDSQYGKTEDFSSLLPWSIRGRQSGGGELSHSSTHPGMGCIEYQHYVSWVCMPRIPRLRRYLKVEGSEI